MAPLVLRVLQAHLVSKVLLVNQDLRVRVVQTVLEVREEIQDHLDQMVNLVHKE